MGNKVYISGMGIRCSVASNIKEYTNALREGKRKFVYDNEILSFYAPIASFDFKEEMKVFPEEKRKKIFAEFRREIPAIQNLILAVNEAVTQSGLSDIQDRKRVSVIVAGANLLQQFSCGIHVKYYNKLEFAPPRYALQSMDTYVMGVLSEIFQIRGEGFQVGGASASGNLAIVKGLQMLQMNLADVCVIAGPATNLSACEVAAFKNLGALGGKKPNATCEEVCHPFDKSHDGFIPGESASCIILEREDSIIRRGKKPMAELVSAISSLDGNHNSDPSIEGEIDSMRTALDRADISAEDVDYINAHGTSTPLGDITELNAILSIWGGLEKKVVVNSTKSLIGHCLNSAGIAEAIATVIQMREGFVHGNYGLQEPIVSGLSMPMDKCENVNLKCCISNSFGFGGINSSIVIKEV